MLNHIAKRCGAVGHGVRAVEHYKAVIAVIVFFYRLRQSRPNPWIHIRRVNITKLENFYLTEVFYLRYIIHNFLGGKSGA